MIHLNCWCFPTGGWLSHPPSCGERASIDTEHGSSFEMLGSGYRPERGASGQEELKLGFNQMQNRPRGTKQRGGWLLKHQSGCRPRPSGSAKSLNQSGQQFRRQPSPLHFQSLEVEPGCRLPPQRIFHQRWNCLVRQAGNLTWIPRRRDDTVLSSYRGQWRSHRPQCELCQ